MLSSVTGGWLIVQTLKTSVIDFARVTNESMLPYLRPQQLLVIAKTAPCVRNPLAGQAMWCRACETGRAYVFKDPRNASRKLVKFAVAAPAIIWFTQGAAGALNPSGDEGFCYFEGSNCEQSVDSRHFGPVRLGEILGKVIYPDIQYKDESAGAQSAARPGICTAKP